MKHRIRVTRPEWLGRHYALDHIEDDGSTLWIRPPFWLRPPIGPALHGRHSSASGRGHRRTHTAEAKAARVALACRAWELRCAGLTIRAIAAQLGVGKTTAGKWLVGVEAGGVEFAPSRIIGRP
jgi:hypothetical protein